MAWPRRLATAAAILTGVLLVGAGGLAVAAPTRTAVLTLVLGLAIAPLSAGLGVLVARRTPGNPVGALLAFVGLTVAITVTRDVASQYLASRPDLAESMSGLVAAVAEGAPWVLVAVALLLLYFPDGRLPGPRWRWVPPTLVVSTVVNQGRGALDRTPFRPPLEDLDRPFGEPPAWFELLSLVAFIVMLGLVLAAAASLVIRFRNAGPEQRRQLKWLAVGGLGVAAFPILCLTEILLWGEPSWLSVTVGLLGLAGIPVATGIAMLRQDQYDVDRAIAGSFTWGLVTAAVLAVYVMATLAAGLVLGRESPLVVAAATAVAAVALVPVKHRVQERVDRRLYPLRRAAYDAIETLHHEVSAGRTTPEQLQSVLRTALRDPGVLVGHRAPGGDGFVTAEGDPVPGGGEPVLLAGSQVGVLIATSAEVTPELLRQVAGRATTMVEMARLRLELAGALREVESSRARLVQIGYDERRRLERDLHDGAQQRLVSLGMAIRLAQRHLDDGTVSVDELLDECVAELATAVAELRQLGHGIRPSSLDDGLPAAVARLVRSVPLAVELNVDASVLPDDVATTAYFVIGEALANAVKHAQASHIGCDVSRVNGHLMVRVTDDGRGGATLSPESGLADRVAALGGSLRVASTAGRGTVVEAALPCVS